jgi:tetratricopeptide (TPR) repeat protein
MRGLITTCGSLVLALVFAVIAAAQGTGRLDGEVLDLQAKPFPDVNVEIKNPQTGQVYTTKTDKAGKFVQLGLRSGVYEITFKKDNPPVNYVAQLQVQEGQENTVKINFQEIAAKSGPTAEELKKRQEEEQKFQGLKAHFDAGMAALNDSRTVKGQLASAPPDQKSALQDKVNSDCQTAATELQQADQAAGDKDVNNHATILANLGLALDCENKFEDSAVAFQRSLDLKPQPSVYSALATDLAKAGKFAEANGACEKGISLDPTVGGVCWKNLGIVLSNGGKMKEAVVPLKKATESQPTDAQAWYLLGNAMAGTIDTKQEGDKLTYIIPPGTMEAYQKCIDVAPTGPYAAQAKQALDGLTALSGGDVTTISSRKKKKS